LIAAAAAFASIVPFVSPAHADTPPAWPTAVSPPPAAAAERGLAVVGVDGGAGDPALAPVALGDTPVWKLARGVYADPSLRPAFDEAHARALAGEAPAAGAPGDVRDLAETRAGIHGDDGPSRRLLASLAAQLHVRGVIVVLPTATATARVFLTSTGQFDAASYSPDPTGEWSGAVSSLSRAYGVSTVTSVGGETTAAPLLVTTPPPPGADAAKGRPFYFSPWFWGAVGAAALGGVAVYFATKDNDPSTIHLQLTVPK
jgi:hypothetical protein